MEQKVLDKLSYGLFVITTNQNGRDNGCISSTVVQIASDPMQISVAINKANLTCEMILATKKFSVSVIDETASFDLFKHFGFQSGRDVDKFAECKDCRRLANGTMIITKGTNAYFSVDVTSHIDLGSHILFIGTPTEGEVLSNEPSATYAYYFEHINPNTEKVGTTKEGEIIWRCTICGHEYVGAELPEGYLCPICKHPGSFFEKVGK